MIEKGVFYRFSVKFENPDLTKSSISGNTILLNITNTITILPKKIGIILKPRRQNYCVKLLSFFQEDRLEYFKKIFDVKLS